MSSVVEQRTPYLLLDVDGVLIDTTGLQDATLNLALESLGYAARWTPSHGEEALSSVAKLTALGVPPDQHQRIKDRKLYFFKRDMSKIRFDPHLAIWLRRAKRFYPGGVALVTSMRRSMLLETLKHAQVPYGMFDGLITQEVVGPDRVKPHPDPYLLGAAQLCAHPRDCTVYEDSDTGIASATAARCGVIRRTTYEEFMRRLRECEF